VLLFILRQLAMFACEVEQRKVDNYWGQVTFRRRLSCYRSPRSGSTWCLTSSSFYALYPHFMDFLQDLHRWKIAQEEARRKHIFISKTEELRRMMVHVQLTQPYREEQVRV